MSNLLRFLQRLALTEKPSALLAAGVALSVVVYLVVWQHLESGVDQLTADIYSDQRDLRWLNQLPSDIINQSQPTTYTSLAEHIEQTSRSFGLVDSIRRLEPEGDQRVSLQLQNASFALLVDWLHRLNREHGLVVEQLVISPHDTNNQVSARLTLARPNA